MSECEASCGDDWCLLCYYNTVYNQSVCLPLCLRTIIYRLCDLSATVLILNIGYYLSRSMRPPTLPDYPASLDKSMTFQSAVRFSIFNALAPAFFMVRILNFGREILVLYEGQVFLWYIEYRHETINLPNLSCWTVFNPILNSLTLICPCLLCYCRHKAV